MAEEPKADTGMVTKISDRIAFDQILYWHLNRINDVLATPNVTANQVYLSVSFLENLLEPLLKEDKYKELADEIVALDAKYAQMLETANIIVERVYWEWARLKHAILIRLMDQAGMLFEEESESDEFVDE